MSKIVSVSRDAARQFLIDEVGDDDAEIVIVLDQDERYSCYIDEGETHE